MSDSCGHMDCSPPSSSVHWIFQARILQWVAISYSREPSQPRNWTCISCIGRQILYHWATRETLQLGMGCPHIWLNIILEVGFPCGSAHKESACGAGDLGLMPGLGRSPGDKNGYPLQYSGFENSTDRRAGRLLSMGSQRVRHDRATFTFTFPRSTPEHPLITKKVNSMDPSFCTFKSPAEWSRPSWLQHILFLPRQYDTQNILTLRDTCYKMHCELL